MLQEQIEKAKRAVTTDSLSFSINEFVTMYENREININPAFQRTFRWGPKQQSNLIESLLIGVPLPPVFVYENKDGTWELIDGLQRTSTIIKFFGKLRKPNSEEKEPPSVLVETKYLSDLQNAVWERSDRIEEVVPEEQKPLEAAQQLALKRSRINVEVLKQPSDPNTKYDLFQRLNRGGSAANQQEVRTCFVVMRDPDFAAMLSDVSEGENFIRLCRLSDDAMIKQQHTEYATRVICHAFREFREREDLNEFLDRAIMEIIDEIPLDDVRRVFQNTVELIFDSCGPEALLPTEGERRVFTLRGLESVLVGVARNLERIAKLDDAKAFVRERIAAFWADREARITTSSGMSAGERIVKTVPLGTRWFDPDQ
jgi:hypothetical protein